MSVEWIALVIAVLASVVSGVGTFIQIKAWKEDRARLQLRGEVIPWLSDGPEFQLHAFNAGRRPINIIGAALMDVAEEQFYYFDPPPELPLRLEEGAAFTATMPLARLLEDMTRPLPHGSVPPPPPRKFVPWVKDAGGRIHRGEPIDRVFLEEMMELSRRLRLTAHSPPNDDQAQGSPPG